MTDWELIAKNYEALLLDQHLKFEPRLKRSQLLLSARVELLNSDLEIKQYVLKKGINRTIQERIDRNNKLSECLDALAGLEEENERLRLLANTAIQEREVFKWRLDKLQEKLKAYEKFES